MANFFDDSNLGTQIGGPVTVDNDKNFADRGAVIANDSEGDQTIATTGGVANSGEGDVIQAEDSAVLAGDGGQDIGAFSFGAGSATNVEDSALFGSAVGNEGPVQQVVGNDASDGGAVSGSGPAVADSSSKAFVEDSENVSLAQNDSAVLADQDSTDVDVDDSFNEFEKNQRFSDDDNIVNRSEDVDIDGF